MTRLIIRPHPDGLDVWAQIEPVPASRPRVTRWGTYYGKRYANFRKEFAGILGQTDLPKDLPLRGRLKAIVSFFVSKPKTSKRSWPVGDLDNYLKTLDVFNGVLWADDDQICEFDADKRFVGSDEPGILIYLRRTKET